MPKGVYLRTEKNNNAKGKHWSLSNETRQKMSLSRKGKTPKNIAMISGWNKGKSHSEETREKMSVSAKLRGPNFLGKTHSDEAKEKISEKVQAAYDEGRLTPWNKGKTGYTMPPCSEERKKKIGIANKRPHPWAQGENNHNWKGGITPVNTAIRNSAAYKDWRIAVFERDNYTCQECGSRGVTLNADHIKPFAYYPELRLCIDNGRTLCVPCHKLTETYLWKAAPQNKKVNI